MSLSSRSFMPALVAGVCATFLLQACSSGSGGSGVGSRQERPPTARPQVLNGGATNVFRSGSEVLLTGKDSEDEDGPLMGWFWAQTAGPAVRLVELNRTTVRFIAPEVDTPTTLGFELTVEDSQQLTDSSSVDVTVLPARDADKFLSLDVRGSVRNTFDTFRVVAALAEGASTGGTPKPFTFSARAYLIYPPRSQPHASCFIDGGDFAAGIPSATLGGCLVELLEDLTPDALVEGGTGIRSEWPANVPEVVRPDGVTPEQIGAEWWNPHFTLPIPRLDVPDFNQQFVDSGQRGRMLDQFSAHRARIVLSLELSALENQADATLILNDIEGEPVTVPGGVLVSKRAGTHAKVVENEGAGLPTWVVMPLEEVLGTIDRRESALTAEVYYRTVDPHGLRRTLNDWLHHAGFASDGNGTLLSQAVAGTGEFAHGFYLNNYDLGFGRDMHMRIDEYGNVYSFVVNYSTLEAGVRKTSPIVTVVMEYSPLNGPADPGEKFVKFFTYVDDGSGDSLRVTSMNFDRRGERFTPGNCVACHGGIAPPGLAELEFDPICGDRLDAVCYAWPSTTNGVDIADGNLGATFLPFDLDSFYFADDDPAITQAPVRFSGEPLVDRLRREFGDFSRAAQEEQFRKLNQMVHATYCDAAEEPGCATDGARRLVEHWYGGVDQDGNLIAPVFDDSEAPSGWRNAEMVPAPQDPFAGVVNPDTAEEIYHEVYAQHCRMCHTNIRDELLRFDTYQKFRAALLEDAVFRRGVMPAARLTYDRFWVGDGASPTAAERLAAELGIEPVNGRLDPAPRAIIRGRVPTARHDAVRLSGAESRFADSYHWDLQYEPVAELLTNPAVAAFEPPLVGGVDVAEISFSASMPGTYSATLTINDGTDTAATSEPVVFAIPNFTPQPTDIELVMAEGQERIVSVLDELNVLCGHPACPDVFGDAPFSIAVDVSAWNPAHGELTLNDPGTGTVTVRATQPGPITASIPFTVTDADLESATAFIDVTIESFADPVAVNDARLMLAQSTLLSSPRRISIAVLANDSGDPDALPIQINSFTQPANGSVQQEGDNLVYEPDLGFIGTDTFEYNIRDSNPVGARISANATVSVTVNPTSRFSAHVQNAFSGALCLACHDGTDPLAPDWRVYAQVQSRVAAPDVARSSLLLTMPTSGNPPGANHGGGLYINWTEGDSNFNAVLRWIEEGARNN